MTQTWQPLSHTTMRVCYVRGECDPSHNTHNMHGMSFPVEDEMKMGSFFQRMMFNSLDVQN